MKIQISFCLTFPSFVFCGNISSRKCGTTMANSMLTHLSAISTCRALAIRNVSFSLCRLQMRLFPQPRPQSAECEHECARPVRHSHDLFLLLFLGYILIVAHPEKPIINIRKCFDEHILCAFIKYCNNLNSPFM